MTTESKTQRALLELVKASKELVKAKCKVELAQDIYIQALEDEDNEATCSTIK